MDKMKSQYYYEDKLKKEGFKLIAGLDEAGRGAWAGPLVAAAVVLKYRMRGLRDSKVLRAESRARLSRRITRYADVGIGVVEVKEINSNGLTWANQQAMIRALNKLPQRPEHLLIDFIRLPKNLTLISQTPLVNGDALSATISAASIIAKATRDELMVELHQNNPQLKEYYFHRNFGYGTKKHSQALKEFGPTLHHRQYYWPVAKSRQVSIDDLI